MKIGILQKGDYTGLAAVYGQDWIEIPAALDALKEEMVVELSDFIAKYDSVIPELTKAFEWLVNRRKVKVHSLQGVKYLPPVPNYPKLFTGRGNGALFTRVNKMVMPKEPTYDLRYNFNLVGHDSTYEMHDDYVRGGWNYELVTVMGSVTSCVSKEEALGHIFGYTNMLDHIGINKNYPFDNEWALPTEDKVFLDYSYAESYNANTQIPIAIGPFIVTRDEIPDPHALILEERESGRLMSHCFTDAVLFTIPETIEYMSSFTTFYPGDMFSSAAMSYDGYPTIPRRMPENACYQSKVDRLGVLRLNIVDHRKL